MKIKEFKELPLPHVEYDSELGFELKPGEEVLKANFGKNNSC